MPEARIRSVRELRCGVWEVDIIDASRKRLRRRFRAESEDGARAAALASLPGPKACTLADGLCASNPFSEVPFDVPRPPRKKRPISPSGLKAARALGASGSGHSAAAIGLTLGCGLKPGEICGILADDLDAERMTVTVRGIWRESIGEPNFFVAYPEPSVMRLPAWLGCAPRSWAAAAGSRLLLEKNGRRRDVEHLRSETNELLRIVGAGCTLYGLRLAHNEEED